MEKRLSSRRMSRQQRLSRDSARLKRFRQSFRDQSRSIRDQSRNIRDSMSQNARERMRRMRGMPRWLRIMKKTYHQYGLKHLMLILILVVYQFIGAGVFYLCEKGAATDQEHLWRSQIVKNRTKFVDFLIPALFNNSDFLFFLTPQQSRQVNGLLYQNLDKYEKQLGIKYSDQKIKWDFWSAMLYAQTICTTIGYGHLYPTTPAGRVSTMLYAIIGIPLVLSILDDLGKLLTKCLKYPWFLFKCVCRRLFSYCTKQSMEEIRRLDEEDRRDLEVFDLPIPVAIALVIAWIFICSATFTIWEKDWDYLIAFYFFFISLSTIGLGDITPTQPKYLLMLFGYIIIGLSLVSMCINLIQAKLERTYEAGKDDLSERFLTAMDNEMPERRTTLGVLRTSSFSLSSKAEYSPSKRRRESLPVKKLVTKATQTLLSFPSPKHGPKATLRLSQRMGKVMPSSISIDDVMRLVDTEEGDMIVLTELSRDVSIEKDLKHQASFNEEMDATSPGSFTGTKMDQPFLPAPYSHATMQDIEEIEEEEDKVLLLNQPSTSSTSVPILGSHILAAMAAPLEVHFRSRPSLIPEHQGLLQKQEDQQHEEIDGGYAEIAAKSESNAKLSSMLGFLHRRDV